MLKRNRNLAKGAVTMAKKNAKNGDLVQSKCNQKNKGKSTLVSSLHSKVSTQGVAPLSGTISAPQSQVATKVLTQSQNRVYGPRSQDATDVVNEAPTEKSVPQFGAASEVVNHTHKVIPSKYQMTSEVVEQSLRRSQRVEDAHDDDDYDDDDAYNPDSEMEEDEETDSEIDAAQQNHEGPMDDLEENRVVESNNDVDANGNQIRGPTVRAPTDQSGKVIVRCKRGMFVDYEVSRSAISIMRKFFNGPWRSWKKVPNNTKRGMWHKFLERHAILPGELGVVKAIWNKLLARRLTTTLGRVRSEKLNDAKGDVNKARNNPPGWISKENWNKLFDYWTSDEWKKKSIANKNNRHSTKNGGISKHCGGSINYVNHDERLLLKLGREPTLVESFDRTHKRDRGNGSYVDERSATVMTKYKTELSKSNGDTSSSNALPDDFRLWLEATGGPRHGHLYGRSPLENMTGIIGQSSSSSIPTSQAPELYTHDNLLQILEQEKKKWQDEVFQKMREEFGSTPRHGDHGSDHTSP